MRMVVNKAIAVVLFAAAFLSGCAGNGNAGESKATTSAVSDITPVSTVTDHGKMRDMTVQELVGEMKTGWNLGNTFDSLGDDETAWGNPRTTHEMIDCVADAGFDIIRIPTTWHLHMDEAGNIEQAWLDRVHEVVDYAFDNGMFVILNTHHETSWIIPETEKLDSFLPRFKTMWTQIAESFEDYGDHLLFEGLNEPRVEGGKGEWSGGTKDGREALNTLNKTFVETVRATGGKNSTRALLITTFAAAVADPTLKALEIPEDDHIIVSLHAYTPYGYTYDITDDWEMFEFNDSVADQVDEAFDKIDEYFIEKDIPVIITEYGSVSKYKKDSYEKNDDENEKWVAYYLERAKKSGIPCVWWDNGTYSKGDERFGIFDRKNLKWFVPGLVDSIMGVFADAS